MSLSAGDRLGPYEITAKLGEGGMGEVYRATDGKLGREVAIKVLPQRVAEDPERLARFDREARTLAQLHHPHVASIFGVEESAGVRALVMELVEGPTLADRLLRGPLPLEEALEIARQIAEALEAAHEKGIVHRDLKPQNIKAPEDGAVKVLDFGLAKALDPAGTASGDPSASQLAASPTLTLGATLQGVILGTAAYMAPEQAKGSGVDKRADIWAFGVVLWEMLTGKRLFEGDSAAETLAGVLKGEIDLGSLPARTPAAVRRLLRRCLERQPRRRLHDIADARIVLDEVAQGGLEETTEAREAGSTLSRRGVCAAAVFLVALGVLAGWLIDRALADRGGPAPTLALRRLTDLPGAEGQPDLSPDGRQLVYTSEAAGNLDIYLMRVGGDRAINLTADSPDDDSQPAFSPDGETIAFRSERDGGGLFMMGATGESVRRITADGFDPAWSPDGRRMAFAMEAADNPYRRETVSSALWVVDLTTGETRRQPPVDAVQPAWSPDGSWIAYWANTGGQRDLWTVGANGGEPVAVTTDAATDWSPEWSPDGRWLYFASDRAGSMNLFRVPIDPETGAADGAPEAVTTSVGNLGRTRFSADGRRMVAAAYESSSEVELYRLDPDASTPLMPLRALRPRTLTCSDISPTGDWLACSTQGAVEDVVVMRADGSELHRLTDDEHKDRNLVWSGDGERILFLSTRSGRWNLWSLRTDGSELTQLTDLDSVIVGAWRPDGQTVTVQVAPGLIATADAEHPVTAQAGASPDAMETGAIFLPLAWSPSGRALAGAEQSEAGMPIALAVFDPETGALRRSEFPIREGWPTPLAGWLPDARRFIALGKTELAVIDNETGRWRPLASRQESWELARVSRDGRTLFIESKSIDGDIWLFEHPEEAGVSAR